MTLIHSSFSDGTDGGQIHIYSSDDTTTKLPTRGFVRKKFTAKSDEQENLASKSDAVIIQTKSGNNNLKHPTVIPLTKEQIDAVLRSLKVPIPVSKGQGIDATTQSSPVEDQIDIVIEQDDLVSFVKAESEEEVTVMREFNEKTPIITINTPEKIVNKRPALNLDTIPLEKRIKLDFDSTSDEQSPTSCETTLTRFRKKVSEVRPSPQRALHLAPEFVNPINSMVPSGDASRELEEKTQPKKIEIIINESGVQTSLLKTKAIHSPKQIAHVLQMPNQSQSMFVQSPGSLAQKGNPHVLHMSGPSNSLLQLPVVNVDRTQTNVQIIQGGHIIQMPNVVSSAGTSTAGTTRVYTINPQTSQTTLAFTNVQLVPNTSPRAPNNVTTLIRPVATKAMASPKAGSQIVAPQILSRSPVYISKSPGGFIPITNSSVTMPKVLVSSSNLTINEIPTSALLSEATS